MNSLPSILDTKRKEFEALGVVLENVAFRSDAHGGMSIHAEQPKAPYRIVIPHRVMLPFDQVLLEEDQVSLAPAELPPPVRSYWLDVFGYILSPARLESLRCWMTAFRTLPGEIKERLRATGTEFHPEESPAQLRARLLRARTYSLNRRPHLMPFMDFANYDGSGTTFANSSISLSISGKTDDEIFIRYNLGDVFHVASGYYFNGNAAKAYSIAGLMLAVNGLPQLGVGRNVADYASPFPECYIPNLRPMPDGSHWLSHVLIGDRNFPSRPRELFRMALAPTPWSGMADKLFDLVLRLNRQYYAELIAALDQHGVGADHPVREGIRKQTEVMAHVK